MRRNSCSVSATSVSLILPSAARSFKALQFVTVSLPSFYCWITAAGAAIMKPHGICEILNNRGDSR